MKLENKAVLIAGASSETGRALAKAFEKEGARIAAVSSDKAGLESLKASLENTETIYADPSSTGSIDAAVDLALKNLKSIDILVNIPEIADSNAPIAELTDEDFDRAMKACLKAPTAYMRKALNYFLTNERPGNIINIASADLTGGTAVSAFNAALISLTKNTTFMYMPNKIRCNIIDDRGTIEETTSAALYLASDESSYINGVTFPTDGSWTLCSR